MAVAIASRYSAAVPARVSAARRPARGRLVCRADAFIGSSTNLIVVASTSAFLSAGWLGLAPTVKNRTDAACKLYEDSSSGLVTGDPKGITAVDVLGLGALGHVFAVGLVLGLKATGGL